MKAYVIDPDWGVARCFASAGYDITHRPKDADVIIWTGGEDINPALYGAKPHPRSYWSNRDNHEVSMYQEFEKTGRMFVGICRGHQLLSAMAGATLYQHVNNHGLGSAGHPCTYINENGEREEDHVVSSVHHQMVNPFTSKQKFEVWGETRLATFRDLEKLEGTPITAEDHPDIEMVWWPEIRAFGFQGHPEYSNKRCTELFFRCLDRALNYKD